VGDRAPSLRQPCPTRGAFSVSCHAVGSLTYARAVPLFRKPPSERDGQLPLTVDQAATLRRLVREAFAAHGREVTIEADHVKDDTGAEFGLWNLAVLCGQHKERKWPALVRTHVGNLISPGTDIEALPEERLLDLVHLRLQSGNAGFDVGAHAVAEVIPGVSTVLAVDLPTMVASPKTSFWEERGGVPRWTEVGHRNLAALVGAADIEFHSIQQGETSFSLLLGESFFTASLALVLDDAIRRYDPGTDLTHGVLVAFPNRHQLAWRAVDGPHVIPTLNGMVGFTMMGYDEGAGSISRDVFWRHEGRWEQLTSMDGDKPVVHVSPEFQAVLEKLV
jgi:hypothetical protein